RQKIWQKNMTRGLKGSASPSTRYRNRQSTSSNTLSKGWKISRRKLWGNHPPLLHLTMVMEAANGPPLRRLVITRRHPATTRRNPATTRRHHPAITLRRRPAITLRHHPATTLRSRPAIALRHRGTRDPSRLAHR